MSILTEILSEEEINARVERGKGVHLASLSPKAMRQIRQNDTVVICVECKSSGTNQTTMICSQCKIAAYCSKECQRKNWVTHKRECRETSSLITFKLVNTFLSDIFTSRLLPQAIIATVGTDRNFTQDGLFLMRCNLSVDPALKTVVMLATGASKVADYPDGVQGMLQVRGMSELDPCIYMDSGREKIWREAKENVFQGRGRGESYLVTLNNFGPILSMAIIDFHIEGTDQVITFPMAIQKMALECVKMAVKKFEYNETGFLTGPGSPPIWARQFFVIINVHIQDDARRNELRLKTYIPQEALSKYVGIDVSLYATEQVPLRAPIATPTNVEPND